MRPVPAHCRRAMTVMESIGTWLRRERELRNIDLVEVADRTRIPLQQLERLEDDRFAELPGEVFVKGYLRAYARAVGLTGEEVLGRFANSMRSRDVMPAPAMPCATRLAPPASPASSRTTSPTGRTPVIRASS